ncbi:MAG: DUF502 domain-containing protein [Elusimicrobia bacterium]|nr:DUF502 domain-containing protein [Elusimicrobiota bacterium]
MFKAIKRKILMGILVLAPFGITAYVFYVLFRIIAGFMFPAVRKIPVVGDWPLAVNYLISFILAIFILWFLGVLASNIFGRTLFNLFEKIFVKTPVINKIYVTIKQIVGVISSNKSAFRRVARIDYPRRGIKTIVFITGEMVIAGKKHYSIFIPTTPNPTSGFFCMVPEEEVEKLDIGVEDAMKMIVSGGMLGGENRY